MTLLVLAFVAGALTALAPCVLPLLPVIIGGSATGAVETRTRARAYVIALSLAASLFLFTILLKATTALAGVSPRVLTIASGVIVILLGLAMAFPSQWDRIVGRLGVQNRSQQLLESGARSRNQLLAPMLIGAALGPVFSSCSPTYAFILATVLPRDLARGLGYLGVYCLGLVIVLLVIALAGRRAVNRLRWAANPHGAFRLIMGALFVIVGLGVATGYDKKTETYVSEHSPFDVSSLDESLLHKTVKANVASSGDAVLNVKPYKAPELSGLSTWINSDPTSLQQLRGKVVLVDFWTYSCINCIRTLPHVEKWYDTYKGEGFVVVGVHAPEFSFEHNAGNVRDAVNRFGLTYPVALDNDFDTWNAYSNQYWPAHYLIDRDGNVRQVHFGEGEYDHTEQAIRQLLGDTSTQTVEHDGGFDVSSVITPETYFGTNRAARYDGTAPLELGAHSFSGASALSRNEWTLSGDWDVSGDGVTSTGDTATLQFSVHAKDVYVVIDGEHDADVDVSLPSGSFGADDPNGVMHVSGSRLYNIASFDKVSDETLTLKVPPGLTLHTFTFG